MNKEKYIVVKDDERPAREDGTCFYCNAPIGEEHKKGCVLRQRTIVVEVKVNMVRVVPEDWDEDQINYSMNRGSLCFTNVLHEINELSERCDDCLCKHAEGKYIREATPEDEDKCKLHIEKE